MPSRHPSHVIAATAIVGSSAFATARAWGWPHSPDRLGTPGIDLVTIVRAPVRGLFAGYNVYADHSSFTTAYHVPYAASTHPPFVLTLLSPFAVPSLPQAWLLFMLLTCVCVWTALWLLADPRTPRQTLGVAAFGTVLLCGGVGEFLLDVGNLTGIAALGLALMYRFRRGWLATVGVLLLASVPQTAIPLSIMLARGRGRALVQGWLLAAALSVPPLLMLWHNTGSAATVARALVPTTQKSNRAPSRIDVTGHLVHTHVTELSLLLLVVTAAVVVARRVTVEPQELGKLLVAVVLTTVIWYHRPYDLVVPGVVLAATLVRSRRTTHVAAGVVFAVGSVFTSGLASELRRTVTGLAPKTAWEHASFAMMLALAVIVAVGLLSRRTDQFLSPDGASAGQA